MKKNNRCPVISCLVLFLISAFFITSYLFPEVPVALAPSEMTGPLTRQELGRRTWSYLHTLASNYPIEENETEEEKLKMITQFLDLFGKLYPCSLCGAHFREMLKEAPPPTTGTRSDFEIWLCEVQFDLFDLEFTTTAPQPGE